MISVTMFFVITMLNVYELRVSHFHLFDVLRIEEISAIHTLSSKDRSVFYLWFLMRSSKG